MQGRIMKLLKKLLRSDLHRNEDGSTAVEYSVMLALIIISCIAGIRGMGGSNGSLWGASVNTIQSEFAASGAGS